MTHLYSQYFSRVDCLNLQKWNVTFISVSAQTKYKWFTRMTFQKIIIDFDRCDFNLFRSEFLKSTVWSDNFYRNINLTINNLMSLWLISDMARYTSETSPFWVIIFNSEWLISYMYNCSAYAGWIHLWGNCLLQYHIIWWRVKLYKSKIAFAVNLLFQISLKSISENEPHLVLQEEWGKAPENCWIAEDGGGEDCCFFVDPTPSSVGLQQPRRVWL